MATRTRGLINVRVYLGAVAVAVMAAAVQLSPIAADVSAVVPQASAYPEILQAAQKISADGFQGLIYFREGGKPPFVFANGAADCAGGRAIDRTMRFDMGSITKQFTAAAVLVLIDQGKLGFDAKLKQFFPDVPADKAEITVQQLLTHTSGFSESLGLDEDYISKADFLKLAFSRPLQFAPGSKDEYSNVGYSVLAAIIERQTVSRYEDALRKLVLEPAGTPGIGYFGGHQTKNVCGLLEGKRWGSVRDYFGRDEPSWHLVGNGALLTTIEELANWFDALWAGRVLKPESLALVTKAMQAKDKSGRRLVFASGSNTIFSALYLGWPDEHAAFIVMTNDSRFQKEKVTPVLFPAIVATFGRKGTVK
jgi:CubicO group peptidase (beta-lactamase class C family)